MVIKILAPNFCTPEDPSQPLTPAQVAELSRFKREFEKLSAVDHPNVVGYLELGLLNGARPFMILEAISGSDVQRILDKKKWLTETESVGIVRGVLKALSAVHRHGIVHRFCSARATARDHLYVIYVTCSCTRIHVYVCT